MIYDDYTEYTTKYKELYGNDVVVLIEIGSFFEIYGVNNENEVSGADMYTICNVLNIQISRKNKSILENSRDNPLMAGFPNHSLTKFINILVHNKYTVVIIEQVTPPPNPKREVTRVISPSTYIDDIVSHDNNMLMVIYIEKAINWKTNFMEYVLGVSVVELSTTRTYVSEILVEKMTLNEEIVRLCIQYSPKELVIVSKENIDDIHIPSNVYHHNKIGELQSYYTELSYQRDMLNKVYGENKGMLSVVEYIDMENKYAALVALVVMLDFVYMHNEKLLQNISKPIDMIGNTAVVLAHNALEQLDIVGKKDCLCDIMNHCVTPMGKRYFRTNLMNPSNDQGHLEKTYGMTHEYLSKYKDIRLLLKHILDLERMIKRRNITPLTLYNIYQSLSGVREVYRVTLDDTHEVDEMMTHIESSVDIHKLGTEDNFFIDNKELDKLQNTIQSIQEYMVTIQTNEFYFCKIEKKEGFVFLTTPKKFQDNSSEIKSKKLMSSKYKNNYIRLYTEETEKKNDEFLSAKDALKTKLNEIFDRFIKNFIDNYESKIEAVVKKIEYIDFLANNAYVSIRYNLKRPRITGERSHMSCKNLRHPIIEYVQRDVPYVGNDITFDEEKRGIILYGINAAGKSSLMKSIGIATVMAQCGMYVAADRFEYYPYNSIHTRILNNDNLYKKQSTFMVEMLEIRNILKTSTSSSMIIGDELCSGTESVSAISIVSSGIIQLAKKESTFIFATHLHELSDLEEIRELSTVEIKHLSIEYDSKSNNIIYDRKLKDGAGETLYGLEVCKSLDLNPEFMSDANRIRKKLMSMPTNLVCSKKSHYNSSVYYDECFICKKKAEDIHHIRHQREADENNMIGTYHKNIRFNLVALCSKCHNKTHKDEVEIDGFVQTSNGVELIYRKNKILK